ncbi:MAG TPA: LuxR C-terminal-related transcriptional regulator, partial [Trebonia sp.]|nr:LuxR C-terminal-related transcriptional regulator [Trebonia sp.]
LAHSAAAASFRSYTAGAQLGRQAIELAERHGWSEEPNAGVAYAQLAGVMVGQGELDEADRWFARAGRALRVELEPAVGLNMHWPRAFLELVRGRPQRALDAVRAAEALAGQLRTPYADTAWMRADFLQIHVRMGQTDRVEATLARMSEQELDTAIMRAVIAALRLAGNDPQGATVALAPVIDGSFPAWHPMSLVRAFLLEAIARDALGDVDDAGRALERALDLAEPESMRLPFLFYPAPGLLERHARQRTAHGALISQIMSLLAGAASPGADESVPPSGEPRSLREPLSPSEIRVLRYLPTSLTATEIASQLSLSVNTVRTHMRHVYDKLDAHRRHEALERARALGLLAPSSRGA